MATINYLYRSTKKQAPLELRLLFNLNKKPFVFGAKTKIEVSAYYWKKQHQLQRIKDVAILNQQNRIKTELNKLASHVLTAFNRLSDTEVLNVTKVWLQQQIEKYYNLSGSKSLKNGIPTDLVGYINFYLDYRKNEMSKSAREKNITARNKLIRFEKHQQKPILIKEVNDRFKTEFVNYCIDNNYGKNTVQKDLSMIKTYCRHARYLGLEVHPQMDVLRLDKEKTEPIYLTFQELERIENVKNLPEELQTARDWLLISCYLGQRVSDFMRFTSELIRYEEGKPLLEFTQKKTGKTMTIPVHKKVLEILQKRGGKFPEPQTENKYNLLIKKVCKIVRITEKIKGGKFIKTENGYRKTSGLYPKYELVTSHIGRRSFATNFYGKIPTNYLIYITGHSTEQLFLTYIGKSNKDLAKEIFNYF